MKLPFRLSLLLASLMIALALTGCSSNSNEATETTTTPAVSPSASPEATASAPAGTEVPGSSPVSSESPSPVTPEPTASGKLGNVTAMRLADYKSGWAGGDGWIARTDDGGRTWTKQWDNAAEVRQLFALNKNVAWAALDSDVLIQTKDGGKNWTKTGTVPNLGFFHFVSDKEAFSGNAHTTDGGQTWKTYSLPANAVGESYFHDANNGWVVTQEGDKFSFMRTTDGARTWKTVYTRSTVAPVTGTVIRSAGCNDAWFELIGDSGMSQTSYSLFHTMNGGKDWVPVIANNQAGSGPAPGYKMDEDTKVPRNNGASPGTLNVVDTKVAFMGGRCGACDNGNTMGKTTDGGTTWVNMPAEFPGYGPQFIGAQDAKHIWWINTDNTQPSVLYTSSDGGASWNKTYTFQ